MKLAVFGATGGTGRFLVAQALERGHSVTAFVRSAPKDDSLAGADRVVTGDARNEAAVSSALQDAEAAVSAMGPRGPAPGTVYSEALATVASAMRATDLRRLVVSANSRVLDDRPLDGPYAAVSQEHRDVLATLRACDLDWTVVAAPMLADADPAGAYDAEIGAPAAGAAVARSDFATALLDALGHDDWAGQVIGVSAPG